MGARPPRLSAGSLSPAFRRKAGCALTTNAGKSRKERSAKLTVGEEKCFTLTNAATLAEIGRSYQCERLDDFEVNRMIDKIIGLALLAFLIIAPTIAVFRKHTSGAGVLGPH
jgi:hypothetical protein